MGHTRRVVARDEMTDTEFDYIMEKGLMQAKADNSKEAKEVFAELRKRI